MKRVTILIIIGVAWLIVTIFGVALLDPLHSSLPESTMLNKIHTLQQQITELEEEKGALERKLQSRSLKDIDLRLVGTCFMIKFSIPTSLLEMGWWRCWTKALDLIRHTGNQSTQESCHHGFESCGKLHNSCSVQRRKIWGIHSLYSILQ
jgi:hypothetical protein